MAKIDLFVVLDFEATCFENAPRDRTQEIIEFPCHIVVPPWSADRAEISHLDGTEFHAYVRPVRDPILSEFCTGLTGITQETVDAAETFQTVLGRHLAWTREVIPPGVSFVYVTCGDWDLKTCLFKQFAAYVARR